MLLIKLSLVCYVQMNYPFPPPPPPLPTPLHLPPSGASSRIKLLYKKIKRAKTWPLGHIQPTLLLRHYFLALAPRLLSSDEVL